LAAASAASKGLPATTSRANLLARSGAELRIDHATTARAGCCSVAEQLGEIVGERIRRVGLVEDLRVEGQRARVRGG
jgi:hypothetical protein